MRVSSILLIAVVGLVLAAAVYGRAQSAKVVDNPSYGVLALQNVAGSFLNAVTLLASLNNTAQPGSVKPVRKSILSARNGLDVFVYAYPPTCAPLPLGSVADHLLFHYFLIINYLV